MGSGGRKPARRGIGGLISLISLFSHFFVLHQRHDRDYSDAPESTPPTEPASITFVSAGIGNVNSRFDAGRWKRPSMIYIVTMPATASGLNRASGAIYFFDLIKDSRTPSVRLLRGIVPDTCGIIKVEKVRSRCRLAYLVKDRASCLGVVSPKSTKKLRCTACG